VKSEQKERASDRDVESVRKLIQERKADPYVQERTAKNVFGPSPQFEKERFWWVLLGCLLTSQQRSTTGYPVDRFLSLRDFPLTLARCKGQEQTIIEVLTDFGGIRMAPTIACRAHANHLWLENGGWARMERWFQRLAEQRSLAPKREHSRRERDAARLAAINLEGIGPKQSRNLWQWLGLTRYEIPLDSRVVGWINRNLSTQVDESKLWDDKYYELILDYVQDVCAKAGVLPCIFDAAAFDNENVLNGERLSGNSCCDTRNYE